VSDRTAEFKGSVLRALDTKFPFDRILAIDQDRRCVDALGARVAKHSRAASCSVRRADANSATAVELVRATTEGALALMFVDLLGTTVDMSTIRAMTVDRSIDLVITWPEMDAVRNRGLMMKQQERWTKFFGSDGWKDVATTSGPLMRVRSIQRFYLDQLRAFRYEHSEYVGSVRNNRGHALYRPLFASRKEIGLSLWRRAATPAASQLGLDGF
jgi:three-Cys-motif partner protein